MAYPHSYGNSLSKLKSKLGPLNKASVLHSLKVWRSEMAFHFLLDSKNSGVGRKEILPFLIHKNHLSWGMREKVQ